MYTVSDLTMGLSRPDPKAFVTNFIDYMPKRLDKVLYEKGDKHAVDIANLIDYFDWHYRRYLSGRCQTLHRVFFEVRKILDRGHSGECILETIKSIKEIALKHEFYEVMIRIEKSKKSIESLIKKYRVKKDIF